MKKSILLFAVLASLSLLQGCKPSGDPSTWSSSKTGIWFEKGDFLKGWNVKPDASINRKEFAVSYYRHKERWDKAFAFLKENDLSKMELKKYELDGDNLYATVSEYITKNEEDTKFESHHKYIDIQYVIAGSEQMSITPYSMKKDELAAYDPSKDVEFMTVSEFASYEATPDRFFIFFPSDIHRPSVKIGENKTVRKVVVKVKAE